MILSLETGQENLALVHVGVEFQVAIHIGVNEEVGRLGYDNLVVDHGYAKGCDEQFLLDEGVTGIGFSVFVSIFNHNNSVTLGLTIEVFAIANALCHPGTAILVDVHVGGVVKLGRSGPESDFQPVGDDKKISWDCFCIGVGKDRSILTGQENGGHCYSDNGRE